MTLRNLRTLFDRIQLTSSLVDPHGSSLEPQEVEEKKVLLRLADNHLTKRLWMDQLVHITQKISQLKTSIQDEIRLKRHPLKKQYHVFVSEIYHQLQKAIDYNPNRLAKLTVIRSALAESMSFIPSSPRIFQSTQYLTESTTNRISMAQQLKNQIETYTTSISKTDFTLLQLKVAWIQFMADHPNTIGPGIIDYFKTIDSYMSCCNTTSEEVDQLVDTLAIHHEVSCF